MTNQQLTNYLSNKQCCLEQLTYDTLQKLKVGAKDAKCKQKEVIFGNILFEVLSCMAQSNSCATIDADSISSGFAVAPVSIIVYAGTLQISNTVVNNHPGDIMSFIADVTTDINNYSAGFSAVLDLTAPSLTICSPLGTYYDGVALEVIDELGANRVSASLVFEDEDFADGCLDEEDVCLIAPFLNKICESC